MQGMNLLVTLDENYLPPLYVMLKSLFLNNQEEIFVIYLVHSEISSDKIAQLGDFCSKHGSSLKALQVGDEFFSDAPVVRYYTKAMYYRLLAGEILPQNLDKVLYLDPDILILNPIRQLYETDISAHLFAAASHKGLTNISTHFNRLRLGTYHSEGYYNSGVLLMNLTQQREEVRSKDIFEYVRAHEKELILPDQDVLNALYGERILSLDDSLYNYDAHKFDAYLLGSLGEKDNSWVMENTVVLHFCGKDKPWNKASRNRFSMLYKHYMQLARRGWEG